MAGDNRGTWFAMLGRGGGEAVPWHNQDRRQVEVGGMPKGGSPATEGCLWVSCIGECMCDTSRMRGDSPRNCSRAHASHSQ